MEFKILVVDDESYIRDLLNRILSGENYTVDLACDSREAISKIMRFEPDLILLDIRLGETNGIDLLRVIREKYPDILVIMITAYPKIDLAVSAMKIGAYDFIEKPFRQEHLILTIEKALNTLKLKKEVQELRALNMMSGKLVNIVGNSPEMQEALSDASKFADTDLNILLEGESGSGKELVAKFIHNHSKRKHKPFVALNCGAFPETLFESELFGHAEGAFTGSMKGGKIGYVEQADSGTLFLDEVSEMPLSIQAKLLRLLENREYYSVGNSKLKYANIRIIAASNRKMEEAVRDHLFREDLFYRLTTARIKLPALRERKSDIMPIAKFLLDQANMQYGKKIQGFTSEAEQVLKFFPWKGNVREMKNVIERVALLTNNTIITPADLTLAGIEADENAFHIQVKLNMKNINGNVLQTAIHSIIRKTLDITHGNKSLAAKYLGIPRGTLRHHLLKQK
ncbi:sigma-54-dependent Fis family transcriptional regulator [candidate division KSB1 bacterium]|nr:sigma-54-dependent Fis family transcriptional regulator [candidate division KSB1 bacterium]